MLAAQQVVDRIVALLEAANIVPSGQVSSEHFHPVAAYPFIKVLPASEDYAADNDTFDITFPAHRGHVLQVDVSIYQQASATLGAELSALVAQVLLALEGTLAATTLQPLPGCLLQATGVTRRHTTEGQAAHGLATVRLEVQFSTQSNDPETLV